MKKLIALLFSSISLMAATASPVNIASISRTAGVTTVTCSAACGIAANQGFSITGALDSSFNINSTATSGSGTTFTFKQATLPDLSVGIGGTITPAKQVIILSVRDNGSGVMLVSGLFWVTTTAGVPATAASSWENASAAEKNAIAAGTTIEIQFTQPFSTLTSKAAIQAELQNQFMSRQQAQSALGVQPGQFRGQFSDAAGWSF